MNITYGTGSQGSPSSYRLCNSVTSNVPLVIPNAQQFQRVECGVYTSLFIDQNQNVLGCGSTAYLGLGSTYSSYPSITQPTKISGLAFISKMASNSQATFLLHRSGNLTYSLINNFGNDYSKPLPLFSLGRSIVRVLASNEFGFFFSSDNQIFAFGRNSEGELCKGDTNGVYAPQEIFLPFQFTDISLGKYHTLFLSNDSNVWGCGSNTVSLKFFYIRMVD